MQAIMFMHVGSHAQRLVLLRGNQANFVHSLLKHSILQRAQLRWSQGGSAQETHLAAVDLVRCVSGTSHELQSALEVLVPQLHFTPLAPHCREILHILECHLRHDSRGDIMEILPKGSRAQILCG